MTTKIFPGLGLPIDGDITAGRRHVEQRPVEELAPLVQALLDMDVVKFGWHQYTPYFNDGEPCEFGAGELWVQLPEDPEDFDDWQLDLYRLNENHPVHDVAYALSRAVNGGEFDVALLELFGDHANITVTREGITVDEYSHD